MRMQPPCSHVSFHALPIMDGPRLRGARITRGRVKRPAGRGASGPSPSAWPPCCAARPWSCGSWRPCSRSCCAAPHSACASSRLCSRPVSAWPAVAHLALDGGDRRGQVRCRSLRRLRLRLAVGLREGRCDVLGDALADASIPHLLVEVLPLAHDSSSSRFLVPRGFTGWANRKRPWYLGYASARCSAVAGSWSAARTEASTCSASRAPSAGSERGRDDPDDDLVAVDLLDRDVGRVAQADVDPLLEHVVDLAGGGVRAQAGAQLDALGLLQRDHGRLDDDAVGDHDPVGSADQRRVEEAERADHPVDLAGEDAADQLHALADSERASAEQDGAGEQVPDRLLGRETQDDGGEHARGGDRAGLSPAIRRATTTIASSVTSRIRKPTVPAAPGSSRR